MATITTATDEETSWRIDEGFLPEYDYETPTEDEVEDRRSYDTSEESLGEKVSPSNEDSSHPLGEKQGARVLQSNEDLVTKQSRQAQPNDGWRRGAASGGNLTVLEIRAPVLRKLDRKAILKFMEARDRYSRTVNDGSSGGQPMSLVSMIEATILETICEVELSVDVNDVTESELELWISQALKEYRSQDSQVEKKMKKLKMDLRIERGPRPMCDRFVSPV
jgi:hypothetical protein